MIFSNFQKIVAEFVGTMMLLMIVVGSGIMGESLSGGIDAIALLGNTIATGAGLVVLITIFGPISGAHFNPIVTLAFWHKEKSEFKIALGFIIAQIIGAVLGVFAAHAMFGQEILQISTKARDGLNLGIAEMVASIGLLLTIFGTLKFKPDAVPTNVGLYIIAAYWFTASTSFANPTVTIARTLTDTFAGIAPHSAPQFILAQLVGVVVAIGLAKITFNDRLG